MEYKHIEESYVLTEKKEEAQLFILFDSPNITSN